VFETITSPIREKRIQPERHQNKKITSGEKKRKGTKRDDESPYYRKKKRASREKTHADIAQPNFSTWGKAPTPREKKNL